jgi:hypothetical protein
VNTFTADSELQTGIPYSHSAYLFGLVFALTKQFWALTKQNKQKRKGNLLLERKLPMNCPSFEQNDRMFKGNSKRVISK